MKLFFQLVPRISFPNCISPTGSPRKSRQSWAAIFAVFFFWPLFLNAQTPTPACFLGATPWNAPTGSGNNGVAYGVAVDLSRYRVYYADPYYVSGGVTGAVFALDYQGDPVTGFGTNGMVPLPGAWGVAIGYCAYEGLYVTQNGTVNKLDANGVLMGGGWPTTLNSGGLRNITLDRSGNVYVVDSYTIYSLTSTGSLNSSLSPVDAWNQPSGLVMVGHVLYVADTVNDRIMGYPVSNPGSGVTILDNAATELSGLESAPYGLALDSQGRLYAAMGTGYDVFTNNGVSWSLSSSNFNAGLVNGSYGIGVDGLGAVYLAPVGGLQLMKMGPCFSQQQPPPRCTATPTPTLYYQGSNPPAPGQCFIFPSPVRGDHATLAYDMAESGRMDLKIWTYSGELAAGITDRKPAGVQETPFDLTRLAPRIYFYAVTLSYDSGRIEKIKPRKFAVIR